MNDAEVRAWIKKNIKERGSVNAVSRLLGVSRSSLMALAAGAPVRAGTMVLAVQKIQYLERAHT